ncbi:M23 family metallopeptidase [Ectothiorhodospiraceae bacterium WFHF3C12]|nr:M23 family metallopeptidase [Ectothiorhodospiraceae bacterium WFHF3C12]
MASVILVVLLGAPAVVSALELSGSLIQGGVVRGEVQPGSEVVFDGRKIRVSEQGRFVLGFDRDAPEKMRLEVTRPDGQTSVRALRVEQREYDIQRIDGLPPRKVTPNEADLKRIRQEGALIREARKRNDPRTDFATDWIWPVTGPISGVYGSQRILNGEPRRPHYGWDIAVPTGTPVKAPAPGVVTLVHDDMFFSGGTLLLDHGHGLTSAFLHLSRITVAEGERVEKGEKIAEVGATGRVTGAHLDWRMNWFNSRVDPRTLVGPMPEDRAAAGE